MNHLWLKNTGLETRIRPHDGADQEAAEDISLHVQAVAPAESEITMSTAEIASSKVRATQEVTEEREEVTEVVTEEVAVMKKAVEKYATEVTKTIVDQAKETAVSAICLMAPVFEIPLQDVTVSDGEKAFLECHVTGTPKPEITWYVDNQEIKPSADFKITYEEGVCTLEIMDVLPEDEGEYVVKAVNEAGTCVTTAYLTVLRKYTDETKLLASSHGSKISQKKTPGICDLFVVALVCSSLPS